MKIPGTLDGQKFDDLRELLIPSIIAHYKGLGEWDAIVRVRFPVSEKKDLATVDVRRAHYVYREKWERRPRASWEMVSKEVRLD